MKARKPLKNCDVMDTCSLSATAPGRGVENSPSPLTEPATVPAPSAEQLKIVIVGHVDHGKSTLVGRLFHDTGLLPEGKLEQLQKVAASRGTAFEWANLMDALQCERDQNVTVDTAQIWFGTKKRQYVIIDAPGHREFLKNMITGAAGADAALLLIDASEGVQEQSRRHGYLVQLLGIQQVAVLVSKMDLCAYAQSRFNEIEQAYRAFLQQLGVEAKVFVPVSARHGDNVASRSDKMPWWNGPTVLDALDLFQVPKSAAGQPLRFAIQDVYRFDERRVLAGRVESGTLRVGDQLVFCPGSRISAVKTIERWSAPARDDAIAGESIGITLTEQVFVERGAIAALETAMPYELARFKARIIWLGYAPLIKGRTYKLKLATQEVDCEVEQITQVIDAATLGTVSRAGSHEFVARHEVAELYLHVKRPVAFDTHDEVLPTGRFVLVDDFDITGGGIIITDNYPRRSADSGHKSQNIFWNRGKVTFGQRTRRNGYLGRIVWLTGLSGAGKSTVATELERELFNAGKQVYVLDGDNVRHGLCSDLGFSPEDRRENIRRIGEVARLLADAGLICITAFISPYRSDRDMVRKLVSPGQFIEVYVNAPLQVCEVRDPKGLYVKARAGEIREFTGVSAPYEPPLRPEVELRTDQHSVPVCVDMLLDYLAMGGGATNRFSSKTTA